MKNRNGVFLLISFWMFSPLPGSSISFLKDTLFTDYNKLYAEETGIETTAADKPEEKKASIKEEIKESSGLDISGFFDFFATNYSNNPNVFEIGKLELNLEHTFKQYFQVASVLAFTTDGVELAVAFIDFHLRGGSIAPRGRLFTERGVHLQVGKFDIPFGNDWQYFASPDRQQVTAPVTTEYVNTEGYNDTGMRVLAKFVSLNFTGYIIRGIEKGVAFGGRIGFTPLDNPFLVKQQEIPALEIGFSYMYDGDKELKREQTSMAVDIESKIGPVVIQWEYTMRNTTAEAITVDGTHLSISYDAVDLIKIPLIPFIRYDVLRHRANEMHNMFTSAGAVSDRLTGGININILDITTLKIEYNHYLRASTTLKGESTYSPWSIYGQLAISF